MLCCSKGYGYCLTNRPLKNILEKEVKKISRFAGEFFDENRQCQLVFGQAGLSSTFSFAIYKFN